MVILYWNPAALQDTHIEQSDFNICNVLQTCIRDKRRYYNGGDYIWNVHVF